MVVIIYLLVELNEMSMCRPITISTLTRFASPFYVDLNVT